MNTLGNGYDEATLNAILANERKHQTSRKAPTATTLKDNLLVDIQEKLRTGKGPGYERWAKVFNLKQMAPTLNYLSEQGGDRLC